MERSGAHNQLGQQGEDLALLFLQNKGYSLLERNLTTKLGEIDLLMQDGEHIVVVEVKTQRIAHTYNPIDKIDWAKQKKLLLLATLISARYPEQSIRIDVITIYWVNATKKPVITHIENSVTLES
jgi:putative endonuclease